MNADVGGQVPEDSVERCGSAREFVDRVRLLVHRLNAIAPGSIGDRAHFKLIPEVTGRL
jgi:hypothetical protein